MPEPYPYRSRRTIKPQQMDGSRVVADEVVREILGDAHWAPTHGLTQPWRFHVFTGPARQRLAEGLESLYDRQTPIAERRGEKRAKLRSNVLGAPIAIAVAMLLDPDGKVTELDETAATACAVQNLMLSAHQRGIGTFWSTPPVACSPGFVQWLGLDRNHRGLGIVYMGYARDGVNAVSIRVPLEQRVVFHSQ